MSDDLLLSLLWFLPVSGAIVVLFLPKKLDAAVKGFSLGITLVTFVLALLAWRAYVADQRVSESLTQRAQNNSLEALEGRTGATFASEKVAGRPSGERDLVVRKAWIPYFNIQYYLGLDGISLSLVVLTGLVSTLACLASFSIEKSVKGYFSLFLLLLGSMMGVFMSLDLVLFYVFFEVMLLPMYFLIAVWGGENREYAAIKFLLYTLFGSVFILVAVLALYFWPGDLTVTPKVNGLDFKAHTFDVVLLQQAVSETGYYGRWVQQLVFLMFFIGFCVKLPSFPFHTWLPDAHVQAPTPISMILAGVLLKIGGYGLVRLAWPLAPGGAYDWSYPVAALGVVSIVYGALAAMAQTDFKKLVAYSSVSHMGYCTLGMAVMNIANDPRYYAYGVNGCMFMMIAHGITSTGMFFLVGVIYERTHTRDLKQLGGLLNIMPIYGAVTILIFFGSMGLPGLCGFVAEVFVVLAAFNYSPVLAIVAAAAVILTAGYILWTLQRVLLGAPGEATHHHALPDMTPREKIIAIPLVALTVILGVAPSTLLSWMSPSVDESVRMATRAVKAAGLDREKVAAPLPLKPADVQRGE